jgi:NAD(P)H-hydrate repair Nnr-like enzyme with NAD(P)H-hydrate dehydratase domain
LDADGLNAFAGHMETFRQDIRPAARQFSRPIPARCRGLRERRSRKFSRIEFPPRANFPRQFGVTLVLKGFQTLIATPEGDVWVNPTGNPGMATGGTGDVLTGLTAGLWAQFPAHPVGEVAVAAVYLHGLAGDLAAEKFGQQSMLAGDLLECIPQAFKSIVD